MKYSHLYCQISTKLQPDNQTFLAKPNQRKNIRPTRVEPNQSPPWSGGAAFVMDGDENERRVLAGLANPNRIGSDGDGGGDW